jgi:hypothetical protein
MTSNEWIFPQSTCERTWSDNTIIQPYSFIINAVNVLLLLRSAYMIETNSIRMTILSFALFEVVHTIHLNRQLHEIGIHLCGYIMMIMIYRTLSIQTGYIFSFSNKLIVAIAIIIDIFVFFSIRSIYSIATGLLVIAIVIAQFVTSLHNEKKRILIALILGTFILFLLFIVEKNFCHTFQQYKIEFHPFVIEIWGVFLFQLLVKFII